MNWNLNDWQGRSKNKVEQNYKITSLLLIGFIIFISGLLIINSLLL